MSCLEHKGSKRLADGKIHLKAVKTFHSLNKEALERPEGHYSPMIAPSQIGTIINQAKPKATVFLEQYSKCNSR